MLHRNQIDHLWFLVFFNDFTRCVIRHWSILNASVVRKSRASKQVCAYTGFIRGLHTRSTMSRIVTYSDTRSVYNTHNNTCYMYYTRWSTAILFSSTQSINPLDWFWKDLALFLSFLFVFFSRSRLCRFQPFNPLEDATPSPNTVATIKRVHTHVLEYSYIGDLLL